MKKLIVILMVVLITLLAGCTNKSSSNATLTDTTSKSATPAPDILSSNKVSSIIEETQVDENLALSDDTQLFDENIIVINERLFIAQTNDIYINPGDYLGKIIKYEGMFFSSEWENQTYYYVIRYGPGCCGYDGEAGFEVLWDGNKPQENDWCEVIGTLEAYEEDGYEYLRLRLNSLTVLDERGAEFVST